MKSFSKVVGVAALVVALSVAIAGLVLAPQDSSAAPITPAGYVSITPNRLLDTRGGDKPQNLTPITVNSGVPGAIAVGVNIASTESNGGGFASAWASGPWPGTASLNYPGPRLDVSNFVIVPVAPDGTFQLASSIAGHLIVDIMGYFAGPAPTPPAAGVSAIITGYGPGYSITSVTGSLTNNSGVEKDIRVDVRCPNGAVEVDSVFSIPDGGTRGWRVICDGVFSSGANVEVIEI